MARPASGLIMLVVIFSLLSISPVSGGEVNEDSLCPDNFVFSFETNSCYLTCLPFIPNDRKYEAVFRNLQIVLGTISFICCAIYCTTSVLRHEIYLKFPASNIFWMFFSLWVQTTAFLGPAYLGYNSYYCEDSTNLISYRSFRCIFVAILVGLGNIWSVLWWTSYNCCMALVLLKFKLARMKILPKVIWIVIMGYGVVVTAILVGTGKIGFSIFSFGCGFNSSDFGLVWGLFVIPILFVTTGVNTTTMVITLTAVCYKYTKNKQCAMIVIKQYRLILIYMFYLLFNILIIYEFALTTKYLPTWYRNVINYEACITVNWPLYGNTDNCPQDFVYHPPIGVNILLTIVYSVFGAYGFLVFACRRAFFLWWKKYIKHCWVKRTLYPPKAYLRSTEVTK